MRYVRRVAREYRGLVRWWITINEPVVYVYKGYVIGQWPAGKDRVSRRAAASCGDCCGRTCKAYHALHEGCRTRWSAWPALRWRCARTSRSAGATALSVRTRSYLFNQLFLDALHTGSLRVPGLFWRALARSDARSTSSGSTTTRATSSTTPASICRGSSATSAALEDHQPIGKRNDLGWEVYPEGLAAVPEPVLALQASAS